MRCAVEDEAVCHMIAAGDDDACVEEEVGDRGDIGGDQVLLMTARHRLAVTRQFVVHAAREDLLRDGNLDWTAIRPPRLTNGPLTGTYRTAIDRNVRHGLTISRPDVAHLMLTVLQQPETVRHSVGVAY